MSNLNSILSIIIVIILSFRVFADINYGVANCYLSPTPVTSCYHLTATPYITSNISSFGPFIEGASVNSQGDMFVTNYGQSSETNQLGQMYPSQRLIYTDPLSSSLLNGIRFINAFRAYVADAVNHRVLRLEMDDTQRVTGSTVFCGDYRMLQPNDLTLSIKFGSVFTSGMRSKANGDNTDGDIWVCLANGTVKRLEVMGRTNGIDLSPDERKLYVTEAYNRDGVPYIQRIWKYDVNMEEGTISRKTMFVDFAAVNISVNRNIDGMKTDVLGNLYVTRYRAGEVVIFSKAGSLIGKIKVNFPNPTNLEFGGRQGTSLFIVGKCGDNESKGCVDRIQMTVPGRTWSLLQKLV